MKLDDKLNRIALFRYGVIVPLVTNTCGDLKSNNEFFSNAAKKVYVNENGDEVQVHQATIRRWFKAYQEKGFEGLKPKVRRDIGYSRKINTDIKLKIEYYMKEYPRLPSTLIYQKLIDDQEINKLDISLSTITRYVKATKESLDDPTKKQMLRYECEHINEVWCGDTCIGPYVDAGEKKRQKTYIIALIDDASRYIVGIDVFLNDNYINLASVIKSAITKYGKPSRLNFDNGSNYRNGQMSLLSARIGFALYYNPPNYPEGKSKIERWFKGLRQQYFSTLKASDNITLEAFRKGLLNYAKAYNTRVHSSLHGLSPQTRFFNEGKIIKRLSEDELKYNFLLEQRRKVSKDNVIHLNNMEYEVDYKYSNQYILLRYSSDLKEVYVVDEKTKELTKIKLLNKHDNAKRKREKPKMIKEDEDNGLS